ncbi:DUF2336 domain-containing protein [Sphingomonas sp. MMS12-HWE2-04]|uniref:DUF2336 domain-containing protein n=1 Tax=Sphingomonas sp. MMS12-HWE2-04 TaxID=3234199 RepID=UPI00384BBD97
MSDNPVDAPGRAPIGAHELLARAAASDSRARRVLGVTIDDFFLLDEARLDERTRSALGALIVQLVETVEAELRAHGVRLLTARGEPAIAAALTQPRGAVLLRLAQTGVLRDHEFMAELIARVRQDALGAALAMHAPEDPERPSLLSRFVQHPDRVLAAGAMAVLVAESRRRGSAELVQLAQTDLPAELHHRLVWWVAAAMRARVAEGIHGSLTLLDGALCDAAQRSLGAYDEGDRLEAAAMRFAGAIDPQADELPGLLIESLGDQRIVLFVAFLAHALGIGYAQARDLVLDPGAERLWLALRALELGRDTIAQVGYALCEANSRRDVEAFADLLNSILAVGGHAAREAIAPLRLHPDYRAALMALERRNPLR